MLLQSVGSSLAPLIFLAFLALIVMGIVMSVRAARKRRDALAALASQLSMRFEPADDDSLPDALARFGTFSRGDNRKGYNTLTGALAIAGRPVSVRMGDYQYTVETGSGKDRHSTTHRLSYVTARLPFVVVGQLAVRQENLMDRIAGAIGFEDINFESAEFSRKFHVTSDDRRRTYALFDPRMIEWYLMSEPPTLEVIGPDVLLTTGGVWSPERFASMHAWVDSFIEKWPVSLVDELAQGV